jgi:hypothetical protein
MHGFLSRANTRSLNAVIGLREFRFFLANGSGIHLHHISRQWGRAANPITAR